MNPLTKLAEASMEAYNSGARLTRKEQEMFIFSVRVLDFPTCYRILKAAKERFELQDNTQK
jgi:hypothetical protein